MLPKTDSHLVKLFEISCQETGLPKPVYEYEFHPKRKWRFDVAFVEIKAALEIEGGVWTKGRHTRPSGFLKDMEKYNVAASFGWFVFRMPREKWNHCNFDEILTLIYLSKANRDLKNEYPNPNRQLSIEGVIFPDSNIGL